MTRLDDFVDSLQNAIFEEARQALGDRGFDRWRHPRYNGRMEGADGRSRIKGECGDTMEIYLKFENNRVAKASYYTDGCASSMVSGSFAAELSIGKDPDELTHISSDAVLRAIGSLPEDDLHCAGLAARAVQDALNDYMITQANDRRTTV